MNIRKEPKNDAEIVGKLRNHAGSSVLSEENGWYKIKSGQVTGYVYGKYLATGQDARAIAYYNMKLMLRVDTETFGSAANRIRILKYWARFMRVKHILLSPITGDGQKSNIMVRQPMPMYQKMPQSHLPYLKRKKKQ